MGSPSFQSLWRRCRSSTYSRDIALLYLASGALASRPAARVAYSFGSAAPSVPVTLARIASPMPGIVEPDPDPAVSPMSGYPTGEASVHVRAATRFPKDEAESVRAPTDDDSLPEERVEAEVPLRIPVIASEPHGSGKDVSESPGLTILGCHHQPDSRPLLAGDVPTIEVGRLGARRCPSQRNRDDGEQDRSYDSLFHPEGILCLLPSAAGGLSRPDRRRVPLTPLEGTRLATRNGPWSQIGLARYATVADPERPRASLPQLRWSGAGATTRIQPSSGSSSHEDVRTCTAPSR